MECHPSRLFWAGACRTHWTWSWRPRKGDLRDAAGVLDKVRPALERLRARLETVHAKVRDHAQARRQAREGYEPEFCEGDYVLYHDVHRHRNKLQARKVGPMVVVQARSPWLFRLRNMVTGAEVDVYTDAHAQRTEPYRDAAMQVTEALQEHIRYTQAGYEVEELLDVRVG